MDEGRIADSELASLRNLAAALVYQEGLREARFALVEAVEQLEALEIL